MSNHQMISDQQVPNMREVLFSEILRTLMASMPSFNLLISQGPFETQERCEHPPTLRQDTQGKLLSQRATWEAHFCLPSPRPGPALQRPDHRPGCPWGALRASPAPSPVRSAKVLHILGPSICKMKRFQQSSFSLKVLWGAFMKAHNCGKRNWLISAMGTVKKQKQQ